MAKSEIKKDWMVVGDDGCPIYDKLDRPKQYLTAKAAVAAAKVHVQTTQCNEAWVYALSHVISRPDTDPTVDVIK